MKAFVLMGWSAFLVYVLINTFLILPNADVNKKFYGQDWCAVTWVDKDNNITHVGLRKIKDNGVEATPKGGLYDGSPEQNWSFLCVNTGGELCTTTLTDDELAFIPAKRHKYIDKYCSGRYK